MRGKIRVRVLFRQPSYVAREIVTGPYGSLHAQSLWCKIIVTSLCGSLKGHSQFMVGIGIAGWTFVSVTIDGFGGNFSNNGRCRS